MKRRLLLALLLAVGTLLLSGCVFKTVDELYTLPRQTDEYYNLQAELDELLAGGAQYSTPETGDNQQAVQMIDLTGDGVHEVIVFLNTGGDEPLQVHIYTKQGQEYVPLTVLRHTGSAFDRVDYVDLDGQPGKELVLGTRVSDQVLQCLHVYAVDAGGAAELLSTNYFEYNLADLDEDETQELITFRSGAEGEQGIAEMFRYVDGTIHSGGTARMSVPLGAEVIRRIINGYTEEHTYAVFVASGYESGLITDVFAMKDGTFTNIAICADETQSAQTLRDGLIYGADIDSDGLIELPSQQKLQKFREDDPRDYYLIHWYNLAMDGRKIVKLTTYYNEADGWYLAIPDAWQEANLLVYYGEDESGYPGYGFYLYTTEPADARLAVTIYQFSGTDAGELASRDGRFVLSEKGDTIYAAKLGSGAACSPGELTNLFRFIQIQWNTGEM